MNTLHSVRHLMHQSDQEPAGDSDCRRCGACCAAFRVSFYWAEADALGIPDALVEQIGPWYACMAGSNANAVTPRCHALAGEIGKAVVCTIYAQRPSPCHELQPGDAQCSTARKHYRLPAIVDVTAIVTDSAMQVPPSPA
jgi:Fe-S-cluster containining protein